MRPSNKEKAVRAATRTALTVPNENDDAADNNRAEIKGKTDGALAIKGNGATTLPEPVAIDPRPPKPSYKFVEPAQTPALAYLQGFKRWVGWEYQWVAGVEAVEDIHGKLRPATPGYWTKKPITRAEASAKTNDPDTWNTYPKILEGQKKRGFAGIGFVLDLKPAKRIRDPAERRKGDRLTGIDLDHCRDAATGIIDPWAQEIIDYAETYAEVSPSGEGIRLFALGKIRRALKCNDVGVEIYVDGRYLTFTGEHIAGTPDEIRPARKTIFALRERVRKLHAAAADDAARKNAEKAARREARRNTPDEEETYSSE
jgi:primase-polymerase (primpol)-like protein